MDERGLHNNYFFTLVKFILFLAIFCFISQMSRGFFANFGSKEGLKIGVLCMSILSPFIFYTFFADFNNTYKKIQRFFFRSAFFSLLMPSLLILLLLGYFLLPKIFHFGFNKDVFLYLGGVSLTAHFIFIARELKGSTLVSFINYLFIISILYAFNLILFGIYLNIAFKINLGDIITSGVKNGSFLIQNLFTQIF